MFESKTSAFSSNTTRTNKAWRLVMCSFFAQQLHDLLMLPMS
jgi:hypothetical protein